jgi:hypothetical protein
MPRLALTTPGKTGFGLPAPNGKTHAEPAQIVVLFDVALPSWYRADLPRNTHCRHTTGTAVGADVAGIAK